ncbi:hypothetical protein ABH926_008959 [Catenulispora sp. GP43]|uniref:hypothetical protein n=1 Tax=Catenulispora sp. GP43 TaxID=3156263 RepID=UPI003515920F
MKRQTGLLFSSAVVLGLVGGAVGGFLIQQARPATPLPPVQQTLAAATVPVAADPSDPNTDDGAKLNGDLRAVLVTKPAGAKDAEDFTVRDWFTIADLAEYYQNPSDALERLNGLDFRRAVRTGWTTADGADVEVDLVQFRTSDEASSYCTMTHFPLDTSEPAFPESADSAVGRPGRKGADGKYTAYGLVRHGNVVEQVFVSRAQSMPTTNDIVAVTRDQADLL